MGTDTPGRLSAWRRNGLPGGSRHLTAEQKGTAPERSGGLCLFLFPRFAVPGCIKRSGGYRAAAAFGQSHFEIWTLFEAIGRTRKRLLDLLDRLPGLLLYKTAELLGCPAL